jgi:hypothetical protein
MRTKPLDPIVARDRSVNNKYIDLGSFYNFALSEEIHGKSENTIPLPAGISDFNGITFDVRGIIQLASKVSFEKSHIEYPETLTGIPVNQHVKCLCFLHSSAWESHAWEDVVFITINYQDGQKQTIPIRYQLEVEDWWFHPANSVFPPHAVLAWNGTNNRIKDLGLGLKLYRYTWVNSMPDVEISTLDLVSAMNNTGYMLYGITCL